MKKWMMGLMLAVLVFSCSLSVSANYYGFKGGPDKYHHGRYRERDEARRIIHRSAMLVYDAQQAAQRGHRYQGLARAIAHQQRARELYHEGRFYREAIFHALRARDLAIDIIRANRGHLRHEYMRDRDEDSFAHDSPHGNDLDVKLNLTNIGTDQAAAHLKVILDIN